MADYIFPPKPTKTIPATLGTDCQFVLRRRTPGATSDDPPGDPVDWPNDVSLSVRVGVKPAPVVVEAQIAGPDATVRIPASVMDQVRESTLWQVIASISGSAFGNDPSLEKPVMVGHFERNDGAEL